MIDKIIGYKMYETIKINYPAKVERKKLTDEEKAEKKKQQALKAKEERAKSKLQTPVRKILNKWYSEFINRKSKGEDVKNLVNELEDRWDELSEDEKYEDAFEDEDFFDEMDNFKDIIKKKLKSKEKAPTIKELAEEIRKQKPNK